MKSFIQFVSVCALLGITNLKSAEAMKIVKKSLSKNGYNSVLLTSIDNNILFLFCWVDRRVSSQVARFSSISSQSARCSFNLNQTSPNPVKVNQNRALSHPTLNHLMMKS